MPQKQTKRGRLWLNDGSYIRLRTEYKDYVWSYDFMIDRAENGQAFNVQNIIDEYIWKSLVTRVIRNVKSEQVLDKLFNLPVFRRIPEHNRSDNGSEFTAQDTRKWLSRLGVKILFIDPAIP